MPPPEEVSALLAIYGVRRSCRDGATGSANPRSGELPNVTVQVIPFERGGYALYGPYALLQFPKALDIVHLEHKQASGFLDDPDDTAPFQRLTDTLKAAALGPAETSEFLATVAADYDGK
jgi:hypothetical protein